MYGIFTYIWLVFMVNVGMYTIHGSYGLEFDLEGSSPGGENDEINSCRGGKLSVTG